MSGTRRPGHPPIARACACALVLASLLPACGDPSGAPTPVGDAATSASGPAGSAAPPSSVRGPSVPASGSASVSLAPPPRDVAPEARQQQLERIFSGDASATALPLADTDPGEPFEPRLRHALANRAVVRIQEPTVEATGSLDPKLAHEALLGRVARLRRCYMMGLRNNPNLVGRVTARITLAQGGGKPARVEDGGSDLPDLTTVECVLAEIGRVAFPEPSAPDTRLTVGLHFAPGD